MMYLLTVFIVIWQEFYKFVGDAAGIQNFNMSDLWLADTLFCEVTLTSLSAAANVQSHEHVQSLIY